MTRVNDSFTSNTGDEVDYRIRRSPRALNVRLQLSARDGLTVVIPRGFDVRRVPSIVERKRGWIETHLRRLSYLSEAVAREPAIALPETLVLPALGESWRIEYRPTKTRRIGVIVDQPGRLTVYGAVGDPAACREVLRRWLHQRTREELVPWLTRLAAQNGFEFGEARIRGAKTRWASCSSKKMITLSYKLLFLDRDSVRCILLHELCHTVFMDHSSRFWQLLCRFEPEYKAIHKRMRGGWKQVPAWVEERMGEGAGDSG
jgi:predicted metal-dependent hydrolase